MFVLTTTLRSLQLSQLSVGKIIRFHGILFVKTSWEVRHQSRFLLRFDICVRPERLIIVVVYSGGKCRGGTKFSV